MAEQSSFLSKPAVRVMFLGIAVIGFLAAIYFTADQYRAGNTAYASGVVIGHTILIVLLVLLALRKRVGELCLALGLLFGGYGTYEAYQS